jgi:hypothetical protein
MIQYFIEKPLMGNDNLIMVNDGVISFVPMSEDNTDYQQYLAWLAEGNTPEPWQPEENK